MGRFVGTSPTASTERGRRYEMVPHDNEEEEEQAHMQQQPPVETTRVSSSASATNSRSALMRSDSETEADVQEAQHPTLQREQHQEDIEIQEKKEEANSCIVTREEGGSFLSALEETEEDKTIEEPNNSDSDVDLGAIHVRILDLNGKFFNITCRLDWSVSHMKQKVLECTEVAVASQRLIYRGRVLEDDASLDSYKLEDGHTIHFGGREDGATVVNISSETVSSAVFPSDSARRVDPLMLDSSLGNCARRVKLWSSFLLIIYTMKVMGQFALLANDQQRAAQQEQEATGTSETDRSIHRYKIPQYYTPDPLIGGIELMVHCFGVYVGCVGFKAAHDTDIRPIRFYCRGVVWLAILTVIEQIYTTVQIFESDFPTERVHYPYGGQGPTKDDIVSANIFQTIMLAAMWIIAIRHSYLHQREVSTYNQSFALAAMNAVPPVHLLEVV
ncbi:unnamed protein product [Peronospora destructor]|uniref:Ubiquitin-like domain-containing protein n=1 Tax=Peronospora destructor TaxID=86335 RepID=A0AAV0VDH6_9STRA|nr:unnamed protein product [Peronospora destructor]